MPRAQTLSCRDHSRRGSLTRKVSTLCRDGWSVGVMSSAACLWSVDVDEGGASPVRADPQGRGLPGDDYSETEHLVLCQVLAADRGEEASPSGGGGGSPLDQPAAEEGGVPLLPERRGHDPCFGDEVLIVRTGRRPPAPPERVPEGPVWRDKAVAQVPCEEPKGVVSLVLPQPAVPHRHCRWVCWGSPLS